MIKANTIKLAIKKIAKTIVLFVIALIFLELLANIYIYHFLEIERKEYADHYENNPNINLVTWLSRYKPHPYFGYENQAIRDFEQREFTGSSDFVIGVLGGSVAKSLGQHLQAHTEYFESIRSLVPNLNSKKIIIANLAVGAGKQPQQFFMSTFFLDKFDMVINVDGFNDASPAHFLPIYPLEFPITSLKYLERADRGQVYAEAAGFVRWFYVLIHDLPISHPRYLAPSSLYFAFWHFVHPKLLKLIMYLQNNFHKEATVSKNDEHGPSDDHIIDERVNIWKRYTEMQYRLISANGEKQAFFFIQPNQYLKGSKPLSKKEKEIAINKKIENTSIKRITRILDGYSYLKRKNIPIFDLTGIFADIHDTIYIDACCHMNALGNHLIATEIAEQLRRHYQETRA